MEQLGALLLVDRLRVLLTVAAQADAGLEGVDRVQVILPLAVDRVEQEVLLDPRDELLAELFATLRVASIDRLEHARDVTILGFLLGRLGQDGLVDLEAVGAVDPLAEARRVIEVDEGLALGHVVHHLLHAGQAVRTTQVLFEHRLAHTVDGLALGVHHLVVLEEGLADLEVAVLDLALSLGDRAGDHLGFDGLPLAHAQPLHRVGHPIAIEDAHQRVLQGEVEAALPGVALPTGATPELVVDAPRLVALRAEHVQAAEGEHFLLVQAALGADLAADHVDLFQVLDVTLDQALGLERLGQAMLEVAAQLDVGAPAGHVRGDRDRAAFAGLGDDVRLAGVLLGLVVLGVEDLVRNLGFLQHRRDLLGVVDGCGADQDRLALLVQALDLLDDRPPLLGFGAVDGVRRVVTQHRHVGRDRDHVQLVDLVELSSLGERRAGHAGQLLEHAEVVLERDRREGLGLLLRLEALLDLDRLVQAVRPAPAVHLPAGEVIDDDDLHALGPAALVLDLLDHVLLVVLVDLVGADRVLEVVRPVLEARGVEAVDLEQLLGADDTLLREGGALLLFLDLVVHVALELTHDRIGLVVLAHVLLGRAGDDQRGPGLVDQHGVDLVDDREVEVRLDLLLLAGLHVVPQVVEAQLVVRAVDDVASVDRLAIPGVHRRLDRADGQAHVLEHRTHPVGVPLGEVVVDSDQVALAPGQGVEDQGQGRDQGLALAGHHLGDLALVQDVAAHELHVVRPQAEGPLRGHAHHGEDLGQGTLEGELLFSDRLPELVHLLEHPRALQALGPGCQVIDALDERPHARHDPLVLRAEHALELDADLLANDAELVADIVPVHRFPRPPSGRRRGSSGGRGDH